MSEKKTYSTKTCGCDVRKLPGYIFKYYYQKYNIQTKALQIQLKSQQPQTANQDAYKK